MKRNSAGDDLGVIQSIKRMHDTNGQSYSNGNTSPITEESRRLQGTHRFAAVASFSLIGFLCCMFFCSELKLNRPNFHAFHDYSENKSATSHDTVPPLHLGNDFNWTNVSTHKAS